MGIYNMKIHIARQDLIKGVQKEFSRAYPFLKIEFSKKGQEFSLLPTSKPQEDTEQEQNVRTMAQTILWDDFGMSDEMSVSELEILLQYQFGLPVQVLRKSGNLWMDTRMNRQWTLRQQNEHGKDIASGFR